MIVNGVTLPDIPDKVLELSQYYIIHRMYSDTSEIYSIRVLPNAAVYFPPGMITEYGTLYSPEYYTFNLSTDGNEWIDAGSGVGELAISIGVVDGVTDELLFSNHDIYEVTSVNAETGEFTTGEIYFPNSEAEEEPEETKPPRYSIATAILDAVARQIMRLTDSTTKVKPEEFEPKLEGINIQLQELTVTATEEVQTITPPSGVYGFSKVIVEAVEDSGGTGGGGTPGEGGDDSGGDTGEDAYAPSEDVAFGYEFDETPTETGYSYYNGTKFPTLHTDLPYVYMFKIISTGYTFAKASGAPYILNSSGSKLEMRSDEPVASENWKYQYGSWQLSNRSETTYAIITMDSDTQTIWSSKDITTSADNGGTVQFKGSAAVPETEGEYSGNYTQNDGTYTIEGSTLNELGGLVQKLTGTNETMTTAEMVAALRKLAGEEETTE